MKHGQAVYTRFMSKVRVSGSACWEWLAGKTGTGYGAFKVGGVATGAHIFMYSWKKRAPGVGKVVRHTCDNRGCVNPKHLLCGTYKDNVQDAIRRKRRGMTAEIAAKISKANKGRPAANRGISPSKRTIAKIAAANRGKRRTALQKERYRLAALRREAKFKRQGYVRHRNLEGRFA